MSQNLNFQPPRRKANRIKGWEPLDNRVIPFTPEEAYDGSKLTHAWGDEVFTQQQTSEPPATTPFCHRRPACQNPTCRYSISCEPATLQPPAQ